MEKQIRIVKRGQDDHNLQYWLTLSSKERMSELEQIRTQVNQLKYGTRQGFQRVYCVVKRTSVA